MTTVPPPADWPLLSEESLPRAHDLGLAVLVDHIPWGAVARRDAAGRYWRALDDDGRGPLLLCAAPSAGAVALRAWAPAASGWSPDAAAGHARDWAGLRDDADAAEPLLAAHPVTRALRRRLGPLRLSTTVSVQEAVGRAILGQLVQFREAERSAAQLARLAGLSVGDGAVRAWPTPARMAAVASWDLRRRCGVSLRGAGALQAAARDSGRLERLASDRDWPRLDEALRALPGVGVWTSAEARLALGDPDAVPFGDYHLPSLVGHALSEDAEPPGGWTDAHLAELLEPFRPQRGRVIRLLLQGAMRRQGPRAARRAPHAPLSAHRYW